MYSQSVKLLLLGLVSVLNFPAISGQARIAGGQVIGIDKAPFIVQLRDEYGTFMCGGTLVTPNHVLTAAHCFDYNECSTVRIVGGATSIRDGGVQRRIVKCSIPPQYTHAKLHMDVAVLKLDSPLTGRNIEPIEMCNNDMQPGYQSHMYGWGKMIWNGETSERLRTYSSSAVSHSECTETYDKHHAKYPQTQIRVTNSMYCSFAKNKNSCQHDSGSPAIYGGQLCGIFSWGVGCENPDFPAVFTSIHAVRSFVDNALRT